MKHSVLVCNDHQQDQWSALYLKIACQLVDTYALDGKAIVREGVRRYACRMAEGRRQALLAANCPVANAQARSGSATRSRRCL